MEVVRYKEKYLVSDKGDIFKENKKYTIKKKQATNKYGYKVTKINGKQERVHRIVMEAFHGKSDLTVDHLNMNKQDNYKLLIRNLRKKYNEKLTIQTTASTIRYTKKSKSIPVSKEIQSNNS